jgi:Zn-dependent M28 family amino/carboxypeptidase
MTAREKSVRSAAAAAVVAAVLAACTSAHSAVAPAQDLGRELAGKVSVDGMLVHLRKLQQIAGANNGTRAEGTRGYDASVDYVVQTLQNKGFDVQTPEFDRLGMVTRGNPTLSVAGHGYAVDQASLLLVTPPGGLSALSLRPEKPAGCTAADYGAVAVRGAIAVVDDAGCSVVDKQNTAVAKGAVALLVVSVPGSNGSPRGLFTPGYYQQLKVPVGVIAADADAALRGTSAPVRLTLDGKSARVKARNVVAQTKTGDTHNVVVVGAHLDSMPAGPGVNDNGTGVAALLETAAALGSLPQRTNAVRFTFWGSEEAGVQGSMNYLFSLGRDRLNDIALYLDFDTIGSPNAGFFTYDGDQSGQPNPDIPASAVPVGSAGIERTLAGYLNLAGTRPADMPLARTTDYGAFLTAGVPIGGATTGATQQKTAVQARLWGGAAGVAFDPNYHTAQDTIGNLNRDALAVMGRAAAFAVGTYAQSIEGVNGVPSRDQRHRSAP